MKLVTTIGALFVFALALFAAPANAQNSVFAPYVDAGIGASSTFTGTGSITARNPDYRFGAGIESNTSHFLFDVNGQFDSANIRTFGLANGDSFTGTINGQGYYKVGWLLLGGGVRWSDQVVNGNLHALIPNVTELVPLVGGGAQFKRDRFTLLYVLPGRSAVLHQRELDFHNELYLTKSGHFRLTQDVVAQSGDTGLPVPGITGTRISGGSAGVGIKFVF